MHTHRSLSPPLQTEGWQQRYLEDGLHLTPEGNARVGELVVREIERSFPHLK